MELESMEACIQKPTPIKCLIEATKSRTQRDNLSIIVLEVEQWGVEYQTSQQNLQSIKNKEREWVEQK